MLMHYFYYPDMKLVMDSWEDWEWVEEIPGCGYTIELVLGLHRMSNFWFHYFTQNTSKTTKIFLFLLFYYYTNGPKLLIQDPLGELWVVVVQSLSHVPLFETAWTAVLTISQSLLKLMSIYSVMPSNHLILFHPLLFLPSIFASIRVFSNELALCIRWPKFGASASASILPMNIQDWFPLGLTGLILRTLESSQCHNSKTSILGAQTWKGKKDMIPGDELWVIKPCLI